MFRSKSHIKDINEIPAQWIFENYLNIPELKGQSVKIKSLFNENDKTPSMYIYPSKNTKKYVFKCFSTGKSGSAVDLVMSYYNLSFIEACNKIIKDYTNSENKKKDYIINDIEWHVSGYNFRKWNKKDAEFWSSYNIDSNILNTYHVMPLMNYRMNKFVNNKNEDEFIVSGDYIYGYFNKDLELYKIYQPKKEKKFIKVRNYVQGLDECHNSSQLIIAASLKDLMSMKSIGITCDIIAPDSENSYFKPDFIDELKNKYENIITCMDNDEAGIKSMKYYENKHNIPYCYLPIEKDVSDAIKKHGYKSIFYRLIPCIHRALDRYKLLNKDVEPLAI